MFGMTTAFRTVYLPSHIETVPAKPDPAEVLRLLSRRAGGVAMLHSAALHPAWGRWTILCAEPVRVLETRDTAGPNPFAILAESTEAMRIWPTTGLGLPFTAGWVGYLGYEAGRFLEHLPARAQPDVSLPMARFGLYGSAAVYDHVARQWYITGVALPDHAGAPLTGEDGLRFWGGLLRDAERVVPPATGIASGPASIEKVDAYLAGMRASLSPAQFKAAVTRAVEYIGAGDIYQVNLARRLTTALPAEPQDLYLWLCRTNPAWYSAYLAFDDKAVLSSSPELFLQVRGDQVITRPIKGTRPRVGEPAADRISVEQLLASAKDRAELTMIVDLQRNDLGRVCRFGTVRVVGEPFALEEHPTVYHLVATVEGRLREGAGAMDLLRATFPGGSITGAPKIRAMQIIDELEPVVRSVYCGAIGCIGLDGAMTMNIAIRTLLVDGPQVHLYAGGGIVADSEPEMELAETVAKARGMARALMAVAAGRQ
jgi:para-aminobenzoate synthetase component I